MIILPDAKLFRKCKAFAKKRISGSKSLYTYRGESNENKMIEDVIVGTLGEWGVYEHLRNVGYDCSEPDMEIYTKTNKSYDADLYVDDVVIHVKSQECKSVKKYGHSWLFQNTDSLIKSPGDLEIVAFTEVNLKHKAVRIIGYCWAKDLVFGECKVPRYRKTKKALYLDMNEDSLLTF